MDLHVEEVDSIDRLAEVYELTYREYVAEGYVQPNGNKQLRHYAELDGIEETTVFGAYIGSKLVGTNSLTADGPMGLPVDCDFPDKVARIRRWCRSRDLVLGTSWRLVTDSAARGNFRVLIELVRATVRKGCKLGLHVTLYSLNPRHEKAYRKFLGLETIARGICRAVMGAPAVLMVGDSRVITSRCPRLMQPCFKHCSPPIWPALVERWTGG